MSSTDISIKNETENVDGLFASAYLKTEPHIHENYPIEPPATNIEANTYVNHSEVVDVKISNVIGNVVDNIMKNDAWESSVLSSSTDKKDAFKKSIETSILASNIQDINVKPNSRKQAQKIKRLKSRIVIKKTIPGLWSCSLCEFKTSQKRYLDKHIRYQHCDDSRKHKCNMCDFMTPYKSNLEYHIDSHHCLDVQKYVCPHCEYQSKCKDNLRKHIVFKHTENKEDLKKYECFDCGFRTMFKRSLRDHISNVHKNTHLLIKGKYACSHCDFQTVYKNELNTHIYQIHKLKKCQYCSFETLNKKKLKAHVLSLHEKRYQCINCSYFSKDEKRLEIHIKECLAGILRRYSCPQCKFTTKKKDRFLNHMNRNHNNEVKNHKKSKTKLKKEIKSEPTDSETAIVCKIENVF